MMMDVLLEEDEAAVSPSMLSIDDDSLITEEAKKLFRKCDQNNKGFLVKMDLTRLENCLQSISKEQLRKFLDNINVGGMNFITESQFIDGIKPVLIKSGPAMREVSRKMSRSEPNLVENVERSASPCIVVIRKSSSAECLTEEKRKKHDECWSPMFTNYSTNNVCIMEKNGTGCNEYKNICPSSCDWGSFCARVEGAGGLEDGTKSPTFSGSEYNDIYPFVAINRNKEFGIDESATMENTSYSKAREQFNHAKQIEFHRQLYDPKLSQASGAKSLAEELQDVSSSSETGGVEGYPNYSPETIFKVVFIGDSAVGKTCFLHRFCHNRFKPLFNATIGVDFTIKTIRLNNRVVAMQLWDTAGQERFRSITKQYFRKADGAILMYDVTSEQSFLNVRNWIDSVKAGVDEKCVMCLVGNKVDLFANDRSVVLTHKQGKALADEFEMLFYETSAYTGYGVKQCMRAVAAKLQECEDKTIEEVLKLNLDSRRKHSLCCR